MSAIAGRVLLIPKGNYDSTATYSMLDMVVYNGSSYICKQTCTGVVPTNTTYWMLNASGSAVAYINDIGDVVITNPTNRQVLMYDNATQKWVNGTISTTLSGLSDTQIASLSNGQVLKYNSTSQKWENADEKGGILPHLIVISETGSTVTATKGQTVITATETSTGHFECDLTEFGTWTIDAILGGDDAQVSLVVDTVKVYTVDDSHFHGTVTVKYPSGATCRLQSADETLYATGSPYTFTVHHAETYTITVTYNQRIYTDTVTFTTEGQSFSKTLPSPSEVDANDINMWLFFGGVSGTFSTLADILENSTALSILMASTDAVDYLVRCTDWASNDGLVPKMTSNTTPSGECFASVAGSSSFGYPWNAFDQTETAWLSTTETNQYVGYKFTSPICIKAFMIQPAFVSSHIKVKNFKIQASNDNSTWTDLYTGVIVSDTQSEATKHHFSIDNNNEYLYYRAYIINSFYGGCGVTELQFYALTEAVTENQSAMSYIGLNNYCANTLLADEDWGDGICNSTYFESVLNVKVPTMTSNTTPSGVVSGTPSEYSATYSPWKAFDGNNSTDWRVTPSVTVGNTYAITYQFVNPVCVKLVLIRKTSATDNDAFVVSVSNNGTNYTQIGSGTILADGADHYFDMNNDSEYLYIKVTFTATVTSTDGHIATIQFYGREDV